MSPAGYPPASTPWDYQRAPSRLAKAETILSYFQEIRISRPTVELIARIEDGNKQQEKMAIAHLPWSATHI